MLGQGLAPQMHRCADLHLCITASGKGDLPQLSPGEADESKAVCTLQGAGLATRGGQFDISV